MSFIEYYLLRSELLSKNNHGQSIDSAEQLSAKVEPIILYVAILAVSGSAFPAFEVAS